MVMMVMILMYIIMILIALDDLDDHLAIGEGTPSEYMKLLEILFGLIMMMTLVTMMKMNE